jgi:transglutaminase/protease-like cytokinesis protein 3
MGFTSHYIVGYSKGEGYKHGESIWKDDHAWNAVKIMGEYFLFDVTWSGVRKVGGEDKKDE